MNNQNTLQHFILTRFNLVIWRQDKEGCPVRTPEWLEHRFLLFERYCLPSIKSQTCKDFEWIVLFDNETPEHYKDKIVGYQKECPQLVPVFVKQESGRRFAQIFRNTVVQRLNAERVITTYLDNDDALNKRFVEDIQQRMSSLADGTFLYYTDGLQYYTDYKYLMRIHYPRNHFVSVIESGNPLLLRTIYGFGSHYYIKKIKGVRIEYVKDLPMWCEVIHQKNMGNDAYFLKVSMVSDENMLKREFGQDVTVEYGVGLYLFRFLPRYVKTFFRRCGYRLFGRKW